MERQTEQNCHILCLIDVIGFLYNERDETDAEEQPAEQQGEEMYLCRLQNYEDRSRAGYRIELPLSFTTAHKGELASARANVCISDGEIDRANYRVIIAEGAELTMMQTRRRLYRNLQPIVGTRSILAVQLSSSFMSGSGRKQENPGLSSSEIEGSMFGTGPDAPGHDLVSQYNSCSFGALNLIPAVGPNIENGVVEVQLRKPIAGGEILGSLQDDILEATEELVGPLDQYDHIIYCIPDDALMDGTTAWTAFTYFHSHWSFFQKRRCSAMSVTIHELGHNLGFRHSGYQDESYGDESGYMGFTVYKRGGPVKCFNGHKDWVAGWFQDRENFLDPNVVSPVLSRLVTFVDYEHPELDWHDVVLMRVGPYYIQYNRAKGLNIDTGLHNDKVSSTYAKDHFSDWEAIVGLSEGQTTRMPNYRNTGYALVVEVCEFGSAGGQTSTPSVYTIAKQAIFGESGASSAPFDFAWVSIYLDDGVQESQCYRVGKTETRVGQPETSSSTQPTSLFPTLRPTSPPSLRATAAPSAESALVSKTSINPERNVDSPDSSGLRRIVKKPKTASSKENNKLVKEEP